MTLSPGFCRGLVQLERTSVGLEAAAGEGGEYGGRKGKSIKKNADFRAFLWFILGVQNYMSKLACRICAPRGQQSTNPWEACCPVTPSWPEIVSG